MSSKKGPIDLAALSSKSRFAKPTNKPSSEPEPKKPDVKPENKNPYEFISSGYRAVLNNVSDPVTPGVTQDIEKADKTRAKLDPNDGQTGAKLTPKLEPKLGPNDSQIEAKLGLNQSQTGASFLVDKVSPKSTGAKLAPKLEPELGPNDSQIEAKLEPKDTFFNITGLQRRVLLRIYELCKFEGSKTSGPVSILNLANASDSTIAATKKAASRLEQKHVIYRFASKEGRGGWTRYTIYDHIYGELLHFETRAKLDPNDGQTGAKLTPKLEPKPEPTTSSSGIRSSSSESNKLLNTGNEEISEKGDLPQEWKEIDFGDLVEMGIHFGRTHLKQWYDRRYCTPAEAQESIWHFTHHMKNVAKEKKPQSPINYFMGVMAKSHYFSRPDGYMSPDELALRQRIEDMKRKSANMKRLQEEHFELTFESWFDSLTGNEINALTPMFKGLDAKKSVLKERFRDEFVLTIRDNPGVDVSTLKLKAPSAPGEQSTTDKTHEESREWIRKQIDQSLGISPSEV